MLNYLCYEIIRFDKLFFLKKKSQNDIHGLVCPTEIGKDDGMVPL